MKFVLCMILVALLSQFNNYAAEIEPASNTMINDIMDAFLEFLRIYIRLKNMDQIDIPDFNVAFNRTILMHEVKGTFNATNGSLAHLSTVYRKGDAKLYFTNTTTATLAFDLGLEKLIVNYNQYKAKILGISTSGNVQATIGRNSIYVTLYFVLNLFKCSQSVGIVKVDQLDDIKVEITGLGPLSWLINEITILLKEDLRDRLKHHVEDNIRKTLESAMAKYNLCIYL